MMINPFELQKTRELFLTDEPDSQVEQAYLLLGKMENLKVERATHPHCLIIHYSLEDYTLEALESALTKEGFKFQDSVLQQVLKHIIHYCEDVQRHNMSTPVHPTKKNESEVFAKVYGQQQHESHDDPRKDSREYK
jgi:hypothetical protein